MKNIYKIAFVMAAFLSLNLKAQMTCFTPSLGIFDASTYSPMAATVPCTYSNVIMVSPAQFSSGNAGTGPCMRIIIASTNANAATNNSIAIGEGASNPVIDLCSSGCYTNIPSSSSYTFSLFGLDPTQNHGYNLCNTLAAANMNYTIASCYSSVPLASGVWNNSVAGGCQTVNIAANSPIGITGYSIAPTVVSTASLAQGSDLYLDTYQMAQGIYTVTYFFNSQATCSTSTTRTISITNPYTSSWTAPSAKCANAVCFNLNPQITGTSGGTFTAVTSAVTNNSFCPTTSGAGTFNVTYTVGISPQCGSTSTNNIVITANPVANAGSTQSLTCSNITATLSGSGGGTYSWSGPGIISGGTTANPVVGTPGNYSLTVTSGGCSSTAPGVVTVVSNTTAPASTAGSTGSITCVNNSINLTSGPGGMTYAWTAPAGSSITGGMTVQNTTGSGPGIYTVTITNPVNGCSSMATAAAPTNTNAPVASASSNGTIDCTNNTINLTSNPGAMSYTWTAPAGSSITGGTNVQNTTGSGPGVYTVTVMNPVNGCSAMATAAASSNTVSPTVSAVTSNSVICVGQSATLTASGANTYSWSTSASGSAIVVSPTITASYTVIGTAVNGCTNIATVNQTVSTCIGINELSSNKDFIIFPNPAKEQITISYSSPIKTIKVIGVDGKLVMQRANTDNSLSQTLNISELKSGIYFVNCVIDGKENYFKIVKE